MSVVILLQPIQTFDRDYHPITKPSSNVNLSTFNKIQYNQCNTNNSTNDTNNYILNSDHLKRLAIGLRYHHFFCNDHT